MFGDLQRQMPPIGEQIEVRKRHGGGFFGAVSGVAHVGATRQDGVLQELVVAVLDFGNGRSSARLHQDDAGRWYAWEDELLPVVKVQRPQPELRS